MSHPSCLIAAIKMSYGGEGEEAGQNKPKSKEKSLPACHSWSTVLSGLQASLGQQDGLLASGSESNKCRKQLLSNDLHVASGTEHFQAVTPVSNVGRWWSHITDFREVPLDVRRCDRSGSAWLCASAHPVIMWDWNDQEKLTYNPRAPKLLSGSVFSLLRVVPLWSLQSQGCW